MPSCYGRASKKAHSVALAPHGRKGPAVSESYLAGREVMHGARRILLKRTEYSLCAKVDAAGESKLIQTVRVGCCLREERV
jgi:hypothetical protein